MILRDPLLRGEIAVHHRLLSVLASHKTILHAFVLETKAWSEFFSNLLGNHATGGQFVLGQPWNWRNGRSAMRLRTAAELLPELIDPARDDDGLPSCSALESL